MPIFLYYAFSLKFFKDHAEINKNDVASFKREGPQDIIKGWRLLRDIKGQLKRDGEKESGMIVDEIVDEHDLEIIVQDAEETEVELGNVMRSANFENKSDDVNRMKPRLSVVQIVEAAQFQKSHDNEDRPSTCIPIITIDHIKEKDIHARDNREPRQVRYRDPRTGIPLLASRKRMHHLSVPKQSGHGSRTVEAMPPSIPGVHPAMAAKDFTWKPLGVKNVQALIAKRARQMKRREEKLKRRSQAKWKEADSIRTAHEDAVNDRNSSMAWT